LRSRLLALVVGAITLFVGGTSVASGAATELFFSEYVEGTSNNKALEIFNGTGAPVNLGTEGYNVQMFFNGNPVSTLTINLSGTVASGDVFVLAQSAANSTILAQADQTNGSGWFNGDDAVVLRKGTSVIDSIGQAGFDPGTEWGTGLTSTADNTLRRKAGIEAGDTNHTDVFDPSIQWDGFATDTFNGLGFHSTGGDAAPRVASSTPANNAVDVPESSNVEVRFSEPVNTSAAAFAISCTTSGAHTFSFSGGGTTYTLDPDADFVRDESCTVAVENTGVTDVDADDPPDEMAADATITFSTLGAPATIMQIQGAGHRSSLAGRRVSDVPGVVTAIRPISFYMQDATGDGNLSTSDGILVFGVDTSTLTVGAAVRVNGRVTEFGSGDNLTITELDQATVTPAGPGTPIASTVIGQGGRTQPTVVIEDDASGDLNAPGEGGNVFDPAEDGIDFYESLEGMLVQVNNAAVVGGTRSFGEITLLADGGENATGLRTPRGGILLAPTDANPERIIVDDEILRDQSTPRPSKAMPDMNVGARLTSPVVGPLDYSFENYKIQAMTQPTFVESPIQQEVASIAHPSDLTVATFNVENLANVNPQSKFDQLAGMIVNNLRSPDIIGIEEVQDDNGGTNNGNVTAVQTWNRLIDAIEDAGGPSYDFRQIDPVNNEDGGAPGANIRVGFLFRTDLADLRFVDRPGGTSTNNTSVVGPKNQPRLTFSPGRLGTDSAAFIDTRKPLVGEFVWKDRTVFAVVNHFSSKGDDQGLFSRWQPPTNFSEGPRHGQAQVVNDFVDAVLAKDKDANVIVLGDINDFEFSRTIEILEGNELTTLMRILPPNERYSYVFEGNSQVLDQILVSDAILKRSPAYDVVHVNAEFADARQASDHEPQVAYLRPKGTGEEE
jgi:predicted extracellular nuclease